MSTRWLTPCAVGLIVLANALALLQAARNRWGEPDAEIELTERELSLVRPEDQSGVLLRLKWSGPSLPRVVRDAAADPRNDWLDTAMLQALGFDCSVPPSAPGALDHYRRLPVRRCFVALRLGEAAAGADDSATRLAAVDAALRAPDLRSRYPDRSRVVILPAAVSVRLDGRGGRDSPESAAEPRIRGWISYLPRDINVPRPFSERLRPLPADKPRFSVRLRFGALHEPWVIAASAP